MMLEFRNYDYPASPFDPNVFGRVDGVLATDITGVRLSTLGGGVPTAFHIILTRLSAPEMTAAVFVVDDTAHIASREVTVEHRRGIAEHADANRGNRYGNASDRTIAATFVDYTDARTLLHDERRQLTDHLVDPSTPSPHQRHQYAAAMLRQRQIIEYINTGERTYVL